MFNKSSSNGNTSKNIKNTLKGIALSVGILSVPVVQATEKVQEQVVQTIGVQKNETYSYLDQRVEKNHTLSKRLLLGTDGVPYLKDIEEIGLNVDGNIVFPGQSDIVYRREGKLLEALFEGKIIATVVLKKQQEKILKLPKKTNTQKIPIASVVNSNANNVINKVTNTFGKQQDSAIVSQNIVNSSEEEYMKKQPEKTGVFLKTILGLGGAMGLLGWFSRRNRRDKRDAVQYRTQREKIPPELLKKLEDNNKRLISLKDTINKHFSSAPSGIYALKEIDRLFRENNEILFSSEEDFLGACRKIDNSSVRLQNYCRDLSKENGMNKRNDKIAQHFYRMLFKDDLLAVNQNIKNMYLL